MPPADCALRRLARFPAWVPNAARYYVAHIEGGCSIRSLARADDRHASTIFRQVRRLEGRRDDPLVDVALTQLGNEWPLIRHPSSTPHSGKEPAAMTVSLRPSPIPDQQTLETEGRRILRRLCEAGAVLVVSDALDNAVVLRRSEGAAPMRTAVMRREVAQAFALKDWIKVHSAGQVTTYEVTMAGRAALKRLLAQAASGESTGSECDGAQSPFAEQHRAWGRRNTAGTARGPMRRNLAESPLTVLTRRRDPKGNPFLSADMVAAGERLREDFELAQMGPHVGQNWERFLTGGERGSFSGSGPCEGPPEARHRVMEALKALGPGLGDIVLRVCCFLEGLETAEKRMGWSARSGKVVLRIALQQLAHHYARIHGNTSRMIG